MTERQNQIELGTTRTLLLATLDYHLENYTGSMVFDEWDPSVDFYLQEKQKTEKDYLKCKLEMLQQRLSSHFRRLRERKDINFKSYIKDKTGYDINLFENDTETVASNSSLDLPEDGVESGLVKRVVVQVKIPSHGNTSEVMTNVNTISGALSEAEVSKLNFEKGLLSEQLSPDGIRRIRTTTNGIGQNGLTEVSIALQGGSGSIYCVLGSTLPINAYWKNNSTIVIETSKEYAVQIKRHTVRSFKDVVIIEYLED